VASNVKVILCRDVPKLGAVGDVKNVAPGFARNYLVPRGLAMPATETALAAFQRAQEKRKAAVARELEEAKALAAKLSGVKLSFTRASAAEGKIFGSVGKTDIIKSLRASGFELDRGSILLDAPLRCVGEFDVAIRLKPEVCAKIQVSVLARP